MTKKKYNTVYLQLINDGASIQVVLDLLIVEKYVIRCGIWYHLYNLKNVKNTDGGLLILIKLQAEACNFTKINTPPWVFFTFF